MKKAEKHGELARNTASHSLVMEDLLIEETVRKGRNNENTSNERGIRDASQE